MAVRRGAKRSVPARRIQARSPPTGRAGPAERTPAARAAARPRPDDTHHVPVLNAQATGGGGRDTGVVVPGDLRHRIRQLVEPRIVAVPAVEHPDLRIEHQGKARSPGSSSREASRGTGARRRTPCVVTGRGAISATPRSSVVFQNAWNGSEAPARGYTARSQWARTRSSAGCAGSVLHADRLSSQRARVLQRLDRRLRQADDAGDRLRVVPTFEIVMVGAHEVREARGFVNPLGGAHE